MNRPTRILPLPIMVTGTGINRDPGQSQKQEESDPLFDHFEVGQQKSSLSQTKAAIGTTSPAMTTKWAGCPDTVFPAHGYFFSFYAFHWAFLYTLTAWYWEFYF